MIPVLFILVVLAFTVILFVCVYGLLRARDFYLAFLFSFFSFWVYYLMDVVLVYKGTMSQCRGWPASRVVLGR